MSVWPCCPCTLQFRVSTGLDVDLSEIICVCLFFRCSSTSCLYAFRDPQSSCFFLLFVSSQIRCPVQGSQAWVQVILHCIDALSLICWCFFLEPFSSWHSISKLPGFGRRRCFLSLFSPLFPSSPFLIAEWWGHSFSPVSNPLILSAL